MSIAFMDAADSSFIGRYVVIESFSLPRSPLSS